MQIIEIKDLDIFQQQKLKPIIERQKQRELKNVNTAILISIFFGFPFVSVFVFAPISFTNPSETFLGIPYSLAKILSVILFLSVIIIFNKIRKEILTRKQADNFFILYGYVDDFIKERVSNEDRTYNYYYIIEGVTFKAQVHYFENFSYVNTPIKCYRYFLLRDKERTIKQDLTIYFDN